MGHENINLINKINIHLAMNYYFNTAIQNSNYNELIIFYRLR